MSRNDREKEPAANPTANPMNNLVPYLDLFCRLDDAELARLGGVDVEVCSSLRTQVDAINEGLSPYVDLLPRLSDSELVRLTGASDRTIRFWRLCQPRGGAAPSVPKAPATPEPAASSPGAPEHSERSPTAPHSVVAAPPTENTGRFPSAAAMGDNGDAAGYVTLSGAPFPGFDEDGGGGLEGVSLDEIEGEPDPLGLRDP